MRVAVLLLVLFLGEPICADDWLPPSDPNPTIILQEARADTRAGRYETALAKHLWFHENAVSIQPSIYGVRLSFALSNWRDLADLYPPAMTELKEARNNAKDKVLAGRDVRTAFHDLKAINENLEEQNATLDVFRALDKMSPKTAKLVLDLAQPSLVHGKAYALFNKYVMPSDDFSRMRDEYRRNTKLEEKTRVGENHIEFAQRKFVNDVTTLVAILAINDRKKEAEEIAVLAQAELDDDSFHKGLEQALNVVVPDPWP